MTYYELYCRDKSAMASALADGCLFAECPVPDKDCGACKFERLGEEAPPGIMASSPEDDKDTAPGIGGLLDTLARLELDGRDAYMLAAGWLAAGGGPLLCSREDGYKSIWDFAKREYGLSTSSTSRFMAINARFSIDGGEHMADKYIGMGVSKLQEMLGLPDGELEKVTQETTVREIRAMKKKQEEPKSYFGLPKTVRPEGSLLTTPGCGDGKHDCFLCAHPCGIRQEERRCRTATCGNPFPCTQMGKEKRLGMETGLFNGECQHLHQGLAPVREGGKEPDPCCLHCGYKICLSRCDVAKKRDEEECRKQLQKRQKEAEDKKPGMTGQELEALYGWLGIGEDDAIIAPWLKKRYGNTRRSGYSGDISFYCSPRGVKTGQSREMGWMQVNEALREIQDKKRQASGKPAAGDAAGAEIIDADFREVEDSEEPKPITSQEPDAEAERNPEEYARIDVYLLLGKYRRDLKEFIEVGCPPNMIRTKRIQVDALELLLEKIDFEIESEERAGTT